MLDIPTVNKHLPLERLYNKLPPEAFPFSGVLEFREKRTRRIERERFDKQVVVILRTGIEKRRRDAIRVHGDHRCQFHQIIASLSKRLIECVK